ncbi:unannotated protein [freshwater metagenome]|uniref:Unannotated protein n=1 Tax=freshwater metagenome TaxID=449393 RepID=A0A6J6YQ02_9ZZZZ
MLVGAIAVHHPDLPVTPGAERDQRAIGAPRWLVVLGRVGGESGERAGGGVDEIEIGVPVGCRGADDDALTVG